MSCVLYPVLTILMTLPLRSQLKLCDGLFKSPGLVDPLLQCFVWFCCCCCCFLPCSSNSPIAQSYFLFLSLFFWIGKRPQEKVIGVWFISLVNLLGFGIYFMLPYFFDFYEGFCWHCRRIDLICLYHKVTLILCFVLKLKDSYQDLSGSS